MTCKDCVYYEGLPNEHFYCEKHNDIFCELGEDDNWCTKYKPFNKEELKKAYYADIEARNYPSEPELKAIEEDL